MNITGTNMLMDLWADIQAYKNFTKSSRDKLFIIDIYDQYKRLGGSKTDEQIEEWKERL